MGTVPANDPGFLNWVAQQNQAIELFHLMQSRSVSDMAKGTAVEAQQVEVLAPRAEPLSFLTRTTVEGIVLTMDLGNLEEQETWEGRMDKFLNLENAYSSVNTITGEKCYMVDENLYKYILLAVAARKQNERSLATAASKLEEIKGFGTSYWGKGPTSES